jgi:Clp amino terminal domain, pathogenicity island component
LLGKAHDDPALAELVRALEDVPKVLSRTTVRTDYFFEKSVVFLSFLNSANCFSNVYFEGRDLGTRYLGKFPAGIEFGDSRLVVQVKLGVELTADGEISDQSEYESQNVRIKFFFRKSTGDLYLVGADYTPGDDFVVRDEVLGLMRDSTTVQFDRFTDKAIKILMRAHEEASMTRHNLVGSEHILLGLIAEHREMTAKTLKFVGLSLSNTRLEVEKIIGLGSDKVDREIHFTESAQRAIELSVVEADQRGNNYVRPEHILLGLIRDAEGGGARVLDSLGVVPFGTRREASRRRRLGDKKSVRKPGEVKDSCRIHRSAILEAVRTKVIEILEGENAQ